VRDIKDAYRQALVEEYEGYVRAGRSADAEHVARVLSKHYGVDVAPQKTEKPAETEGDDAPERTDEERPPENTAKPAAKRGPGRPRKAGQAGKD
jgi:hypothetical protein